MQTQWSFNIKFKKNDNGFDFFKTCFDIVICRSCEKHADNYDSMSLYVPVRPTS